MQNNRFSDVVNRSENGPFIKEAAFDLALARKTSELAAKYAIKYDPKVLVPSDDAMADRLYQASLELFLEMGVYNQSTERRILFTREEVETAVAAAPKAVTLGCGKDAIVEQHREVESLVPCRMHSGPTGTPCSEHLHPLILQACAQEPLVDCLGGGSVATYQGRLIIANSPTEILASRKEAALARQAVLKAGRPGMHIEDVAVPLTCPGKMAAIDPIHGLRATDGLLVSQLPELKTNYDQLSRAAYMQGIGMHIVDLMTPLVGGLGGGAPGTAIVTVASHILGVLCYSVSYHFMGHMNLQWSHNTDRMGLWIQAMAGQALARNTPVVAVNDLYTRSGLGTAEVLWEVAAGAIVGAVCGLNQHGVGATCGTKIDHTSGVEARFQAQVAHAALGITRQQASELLLECLVHYEHTLPDPNPGKPFAELYDLGNLEPGQEWLDIYYQVCHELTRMGLQMDEAWRKVRQNEYPI